MKKLIPLFLVLICSVTFSQSKKELNAELLKVKNQINVMSSEIQSLKDENVKLRSDITHLSNENESLKSKLGSSQTGSTEPTEKSISSNVLQCKATTAEGTQCKRNANQGSDYCWQHQKSTGVTKSTKPSSSSGSGKTIHTGPRGGKYYINKNGNKTYIKK